MIVKHMWVVPVLAVTFLGYALSSSDLKSFDDSILFKINWPGRNGNDFGLLDIPSEETLLITTENNEKYKCLLPHFQEKEKDQTESYTGPSAYELLSPLFAQASCSYRLESYWTYEVCHGQHVRQYHEEREGKKAKLQEFYLGKWDSSKSAKLKESLIEEETVHRPRFEAQVKKIDGLNMPYLQLNMTDGTLCDLSQNPRQTKLLYVCYPHGKHEVYSLKETSTCEYEVIVLSPLLCQHPKYKPQESGENIVNCHPLEGTPKKPKNLLSMEAESLKLRHQKTEEQLQKVYAVFSVDKSGEGQDQETRVRVEIHPVELIDEMEAAPAEGIATVDVSPVINFLSGKNCLHGGSGWWKYEFCYGKSVDQYHVDKDSKRTVVHLGKFVKADHLDWLEQNPHKRPKPLEVRKSISHLYTMGSVCDKTGKPRQTEVQLKCSQPGGGAGANSPASVALYLLEPRMCEYILGVESPLICKILAQADENGLIEMTGSLASLGGGQTAHLGNALEGEESDEEGGGNSEEVEQDLDATIPNGDE